MIITTKNHSDGVIYSATVNGYKFKSSVYNEGNNGYYEVKVKNQIYCREDAKLDIWITDIEKELKELTMLKEFLNGINKLRTKL